MFSEKKNVRWLFFSEKNVILYNFNWVAFLLKKLATPTKCGITRFSRGERKSDREEAEEPNFGAVCEGQTQAVREDVGGQNRGASEEQLHAAKSE